MKDKSINGFVLQYPLGVGGMAEVWYAENDIHKPAAVKILNEKFSINNQIVERFRKEAEIMVKLNHQNIRQVYGYGSIDGRPAIIMEYLEGDDLKARMKKGQRFTETELEHWWNQLVDALNYTHKRGVIHRDIKPGNIFVDTEGDIKLLDFGIAKVRESISSTSTGQQLGTLMYMSPEQVKDSKRIDYRSDSYSLAVTFVHLLTGQRPYDSEKSSEFEISEQIVYNPLDLRLVPKMWQKFLFPYLQKEPDKRPQLRHFSASELMVFKDDDDDATVAEEVEQPKDTGREKQSAGERKKKKGKGFVIGGITVGVAAVAVLLLTLKPFAMGFDKNEPAVDTLGMIRNDLSTCLRQGDSLLGLVPNPTELGEFAVFMKALSMYDSALAITKTYPSIANDSLRLVEKVEALHVLRKERLNRELEAASKFLDVDQVDFAKYRYENAKALAIEGEEQRLEIIEQRMK